MASYKVVPKPSVEKDLRSLSKAIIRRVVRVVESLRNDPFPHQAVKLEGADDLYRVRVGDYRIIYTSDSTQNKIHLLAIGYRRDIYRNE